MNALSEVGVVVIGRNEGQRLAKCLSSRELCGVPTVYVDSGSSDDSLSIAGQHGVPILELPATLPFTAARARNAGFTRLLQQFPNLAFVQFVDADSELQQGWLRAGFEFLRDNHNAAAVCGTVRERNPEASIFNRLCDLEWQMPTGEVPSSGGIAMFRSSSFEEESGFRDDLIAGEEPDLCFRLRKSGWSIIKLDVEMAMHDAAMTRVGQWWARSKRSGYAAAQTLSLRGTHERGVLRAVLGNIFWALPPGWLLWPILWIRVQRERGAAYATHIVLGKIPHLQGQITFWLRRMRRKQVALIEHK